MKYTFLFVLGLIFLTGGHAQVIPFHFALVSDTHIGSPNGGAEQDLRRTVADINQRKDLAFVVITGDITELGKNEQLRLAKQILDSLHIPYYIIPGNHDTGWSESGGFDFTEIFGSDHFLFDYHGIRFMGCASGPYVRMSDGHIPRDAINWMKTELAKIPASQPLIFFNHYPIDNSLDNWYDALDLLKQHNTIAILCGHGHANHAYRFEDIPGVMGRSNLRVKDPVGGYNLVEVRTDSILFSERRPGVRTLPVWTGIRLEEHHYDLQKKFPRPSYAVNDSFPEVTARWTYSSDANVISTPVVTDGLVIFGNSRGMVCALDELSGKKVWEQATGAAIYSSPAAEGNRVILGSADGKVYCLDSRTGKVMWTFAAKAAVLGCPLIYHEKVYIGASDHRFYALSLQTGHETWEMNGLEGPVVSTPVITGRELVFGAWDTYLYAVDTADGRLLWKWSNGSPIANYSPASCVPLIHNNTIYIAAPDRYMTAIDALTGKTLWRTSESAVRESTGMSADGQLVYAKTMTDTIVAFHTGREKEPAAWKMDAGFGYEHVPSMLVEKDGLVFFGTRNGRVYAIDPARQRIAWIHKIDNAMVNTVRVLSGKRLVAATMDGKVTLLETR